MRPRAGRLNLHRDHPRHIQSPPLQQNEDYDEGRGSRVKLVKTSTHATTISVALDKLEMLMRLELRYLYLFFSTILT